MERGEEHVLLLQFRRQFLFSSLVGEHIPLQSCCSDKKLLPQMSESSDGLNALKFHLRWSDTFYGIRQSPTRLRAPCGAARHPRKQLSQKNKQIFHFSQHIYKSFRFGRNKMIKKYKNLKTRSQNIDCEHKMVGFIIHRNLFVLTP